MRYVIEFICIYIVLCDNLSDISIWCVSMSDIVLARDGIPPSSQWSCRPFPGVVPCFVVRFLLGTCLVVPARDGFANFHVVCMLDVVIVTNFIGKWIMAYWK